jgi:hypothetical protein
MMSQTRLYIKKKLCVCTTGVIENKLGTGDGEYVHQESIDIIYDSTISKIEETRTPCVKVIEYEIKGDTEL